MRVVGDIMRVPWANGGIPVESKMRLFFRALEELEDALDSRNEFYVLFAALSCLVIMRFIASTKPHPRLAILMRTLIHGFDDLWHFGLLFSIIYAGFACTAVLQFGAYVEAFKDFRTAFMTQWELMQGNLPEQGLDRYPLIFYTIFFHLIVFFLMINFLLAIIVEAFLKCKEDAQNDETEKSFLTDVALTIHAYIVGFRNRWPSRLVIAQELAGLDTFRVTDSQLAKMFPEWDHTSRAAFFKYYLSYPFCHIKQHKERLQGMSTEKFVEEVGMKLERMFDEHRDIQLFKEQEQEKAEALRKAEAAGNHGNGVSI